MVSTDIRPLTRRSRKGTPYTRPLEIQAWLERLSAVAEPDRNRQLIAGETDGGETIPVEAVLYFARNAWRAKDRATSEPLFKALHNRLDEMVQKTLFDSRIATASEIREEIMAKLVAWIAQDCSGDDKLDYLEAKCASALAALRVSALRKHETRARNLPTTPLITKNRDTGREEIAKETEDAAQSFLEQVRQLLDQQPFRSTLYAAIDKLPKDQRTVILLLVEGVPIDCKDDKMTISRMLKCDERTVRNRRDRGVATLRMILGTEADHE